MKRRARDGDAGDLHRLQYRPGIERPGAPHVHLNVEQLGLGDFGRELPRDRPARLASADHAKLGVERETIDFYHDAVSLKGQGGDQRLVAFDLLLHLSQ